MDQRIFSVDAIALDDAGRVVLSDAQLDALVKQSELVMSGGPANLGCAGYNKRCHNYSCQGGNNVLCINDGCSGTSNNGCESQRSEL